MNNLQYPYYSVKSILASAVENPDSGHYSIFIDSATNRLSVKDWNGVTTLANDSLYTANGIIGSNRTATLTDTLSFAGGRVSFDTTDNGILLPRLTTAEMNAIVSPATHLLVFNTDLNCLYRYDGSAWVALVSPYGGRRYTLIKPNGTQQYYDTLNQVRLNWADGDVLHQFADETIDWVLSASDSMFILPTINWNGNGFKITMQNFTNSNTVGFLITSKTVSIFDLNFDVNINENNTFFIRVGGTGVLNLSNVKGVQINTTGVGANTFMLDFSSTAILNGDRNTVFSSLGTIVMSGANATVVGYQGTSGNIVNGVTFNNFRALTSLNGSNNVVNGARLSGNSTLTNFTFNQTFSTEAFASGTFNIQDAKIRVNCSTLTNGTVVTNFTDVFFENLSTGQFQTNGCLLIDSYFTMNGVNYEGSGGITARGCTFISTNGVQNIREQTGFVDVQDCTFIANNTTTSGCNLLPIGTGFRVVDCILIKNGANGGNIRLGSAVPATINLLGNTYNKGVDYLFSLTAGIGATAKASNVNRLTQSIDYLGQKGIGLSSPFPKMTTTERNALTNIEKGYTIENTTTNFLQVYNGSTWKDLLDLT